MKYEFNGEYSNFKVMIDALINMYKANPQLARFADWLHFYKMFSCVRSTDMDFKYDSEVVVELIKGLAVEFILKGEGEFAQLSQMFEMQQQMIRGFVEQGKGMVMFLADYMEMLKNVNFDRYSLSIALPNTKAFTKFTLHLPGITSFLNENFFN